MGSSAPSATTTSVNFFPLLLAGEDRLADVFERPGDLRNQNHVAAAGDARVEGDPAGVAAHHFQHHHPLVAGGGGVQAVEGVGGAEHGAEEAEREGGGGEIVVDGLGDADHRNAVLVKLLGDRQRAVAADADQPAEVEMLDRGLDAGDELRIELEPVVDADRGGEAALVRRAEDRAALAENAGGVLVVERHVADGIDQPFVALEKADDFVAVRVGALHDAANDGVQAGAIAAGGENPDPFLPLPCSAPICRMAFPGSPNP